MLCPEVCNFPPPKVYCTQKENLNLETVLDLIKINNFNKSVIITCPDELTTDFVQDILSEDSDYYKLSDCCLMEFLDNNFIEYFVKRGKVTCLSDRNCIVQNCAAITPDGILTLHVLEFIYQTLGIEGIKRPHSYYEIKFDLKCITKLERVKIALSKLESFDFYLTWEPNNDEVCPSSIAKYFQDRNIGVSVQKISLRTVTPHITQVPTLTDVDVDEIVEWMGMLAHKADLTPTEDYISMYCEPFCENPIKSTRMSILIAKGFVTPSILTKVCAALHEYVMSRELDNYWVAMSIQGHDESLWQVSANAPRMFQSHNSSTTVFLTRESCTVYSIAQLKYS